MVQKNIPLRCEPTKHCWLNNLFANNSQGTEEFTEELDCFLRPWRVSLHPQEMVATERAEEPYSQSLFVRVKELRPREAHPLLAVIEQGQFQNCALFPTHYT